ncbi:MAG: hypothetical protein JXQ87_19030 [Bacteroidia bacterium]
MKNYFEYIKNSFWIIFVFLSITAILIDFRDIVLVIPFLVIILIISLGDYKKVFRPIHSIKTDKRNLHIIENCVIDEIHLSNRNGLMDKLLRQKTVCDIYIQKSEFFIVFKDIVVPNNLIIIYKELIKVQNDVWYYRMTDVINDVDVAYLSDIVFQKFQTELILDQNKVNSITNNKISISCNLKKAFKETDLLN